MKFRLISDEDVDAIKEALEKVEQSGHPYEIRECARVTLHTLHSGLHRTSHIPLDFGGSE